MDSPSARRVFIENSSAERFEKLDSESLIQKDSEVQTLNADCEKEE